MTTSRKLCAHDLTDNDDNGETAAGGRLAHLLQILVSTGFSHHVSEIYW